MAKDDVYRARRSFFADVKGQRRAVRAGALVAGDDPVLKGRETLFERTEEHLANQQPRVEQATAAPGETRNVTPPSSHTCEECGRGFDTAAALGSHKRVHADDE